MSEDENDNNINNDEQSIQVKFTTRQSEFSIPSTVFSITSQSTPVDLSQLVNAVLKGILLIYK